ncbi:MAG: protein kinase [Ideonella sp.]|nr:protein kinase [Ideonella sp.]
MPDASTSTMTVPMPQQASARPGLAALADHDALRTGTRLGEFEIVRVLGVGGFGIVYLALDHVLQREVAIKEYLPVALAGRGEGARVSMRSAALADTFELGLESFCSEARLLARFDHPSLVRVHRFWKANGTAYMAMPYYPGPTLKEARRGMTRSPDEAWLRAFVEPLLSALELLHRENVYHRDITPDNILLLSDGRPVLLDFGAARRVIGDKTQALTAVLKPNFAPVEQYADVADLRQGPWTDLYALGATVHFMLVGAAPMPAVLRAVHDSLPPLSASGAAASFPGVSAGFLATIDWTLALAPGKRPQCIAAVRQALNGDVAPPPPIRRFVAEPLLPQGERDPAVDRTGHAVPRTPAPAAALDAVTLQVAGQPARSRGVRPALAAAVLLSLITLGWSTQVFNRSATVATATTLNDMPAAVASPSLVAAPPVPSAILVRTPAPSAPAGGVAPSRPRPSVRAATRVAAPAPAPAFAQEQNVAHAGPEGPKAACGDINFIALAMCLGRECQTSRWQAHPQCVELRQADEQRRRRMDEQ